MSVRTRIDTFAARAVLGLPVLVFAGLVAMAAWRLATWFWVFAPSPPAVAVDRRVPEGASVAAARHWFGEPVVSVVARGALGGSEPAATGGLRLVGVISGGKSPAALLADGKSQFEVLAGEIFGDGQKLRKVAADHVVIERHGEAIRVELEGAATGRVSGAGAVPATNATGADTEAKMQSSPAKNPGRGTDRTARRP